MDEVVGEGVGGGEGVAAFAGVEGGDVEVFGPGCSELSGMFGF